MTAMRTDSQSCAIHMKVIYPRVVVSIDAGERDADQMAADITRPAEIALREIPGVKQVRSTTSRAGAPGLPRASQ